MHYYFKREIKTAELQIIAIIADGHQPTNLLHRADAILDDKFEFKKNRWPEDSAKSFGKLIITQEEAIMKIRALGAELILAG